MKREYETKVKTYIADEPGYKVDIVETVNHEFGIEVYEAWLYHEDTNMKMNIYNEPKDRTTYRKFVADAGKMAMNNIGEYGLWLGRVNC